ncbi:hypothetical protein LguiB_010655 [Lonicera macranthoides]
MASIIKSCWVSPYFSLNSDFYRHRSRVWVRVRSLGAEESAVVSSDSIRVNGVSLVGKNGSLIDVGNEGLTLNIKEKKSEENFSNKLEPLWDDGYGTQTVKDYHDFGWEMIKPDGGPPRWFCPVACGCPLKDSPVLLFLPGLYGLGYGLVLHHKALGKVFEVRCLHIPLNDRMPFQGLVKLVEETVRLEHASSPNKTIYLVGDSFGGCLALAVAARNPTIDLVVILANPATSIERSQIQPLVPILEALPDELHAAVPYLLSFITGVPSKLETLTPAQVLAELSRNLAALPPRISALSDTIPKGTFIWKMKLLKSGAAYANSRLHAVKAEVLILASGKDELLPSGDEARRLSSSLQNCEYFYFKDNGHAILLEDGVNLLTVIKGACKYRRSGKHDFVKDFLPPSMSEFKQAFEDNRWFRFATSPVMLSTLEDGKIVRGLAGVPNEGPVLLVGYHVLLGMELAPLVLEFLREKKILVRGVAHPKLFEQKPFQSHEFQFLDMLKVFGATPVTASNLFKLFKNNSHVLLYPGGAREAFHRKGEEYKLFWPDQPEFVRMAARFGATIIPFGVVGEDDLAEIVLDYNDMMAIPVLNDLIRRTNGEGTKLRTEMDGEIANQDLHVPGVLPKIPGRLYFLFGKPIQTQGKEVILKDKETSKELYLHIKSEVEESMTYLIKKREEDPYRGIFERTIYAVGSDPVDRIPTFEA